VNKKNAKKPIIFFPEDTHYSIIKIARVLDLPTFADVGKKKYPRDNPLGYHEEWPQTVPSDVEGNGTVDVEKLLKLVEFFAAKGHPPLVVLNYGTTFKGAYDDVETIGTRLVKILDKYGLNTRKMKHDTDQAGERKEQIDERNGYWIHVDAALGGTYAPFLRLAHEKGLYKGPLPPRFDFALPFVHSINTSGHKWPGAPWPCGLFLTKVAYQIKPPTDPAYIGSPDTTFAGSRNGFSAMILWDFLAHNSYEKQTKFIMEHEDIAQYAHEQIAKLGAELGARVGQTEEEKKDWLWTARSPSSLTIRFRRPNKDLVTKFSLSGESMYVNESGKALKPAKSEGENKEKEESKSGDPPKEKKRVQRDYAHIYIMNHITKEKIDKLVDALRHPNAFKVADNVVVKQKSERFIKIAPEKHTFSIAARLPKFSAIIEEFGDLKAHAFHENNNRRGF